jgi:GTP-binding protein
MFSDVATINVRGGCGGDGCMALLREHKLAQGGPSGGNGGSGGDVYIELDPSLWSLESLKRKVHFRARDGGNGLGKSKHGTRGEDAIIRVSTSLDMRLSLYLFNRQAFCM